MCVYTNLCSWGTEEEVSASEPRVTSISELPGTDADWIPVLFNINKHSQGPQNIFHSHKSFCLVFSNSHQALSASPPPILSFSLPCHLPSPLLASGSIKSYSAFKLLSLSQAKCPDFYRQKPSSPSTLILTSLTRRKTLSKSQVCRCTPDFLSSLSLLFFWLFVCFNK